MIVKVIALFLVLINLHCLFTEGEVSFFVNTLFSSLLLYFTVKENYWGVMPCLKR